MRKIFLLLIFFTHSFTFCAFSQDNIQELKILTYNIYHGEDPNQPGLPNLDEIAELIKIHQPDMVALQEMDSMTTRLAAVYGEKINWVSELGKRTGYTSYFAKAMDFAEGGYGEGILVKKATNFITQVLPTPAGGESRAAAWAKIELKNKEEIYFGATHLCHEFPENRLAQVAAITDYAASLDKPAVWVGDLNFDPTSEEYKSIHSKWSDAGLVAKDNSPTYDSEKGKRIDYVWYDSEHFHLIDYQVLDVPFSDHYPVLVTLRLITPQLK